MQRTSHFFNASEVTEAQIIEWASQFDPCVFFNSHSDHNPQYAGGHTYQLLLGVGQLHGFESTKNSFEKLQSSLNTHADWHFGMLSYDVKNELEDLSSAHKDYHQLPHMHFFCPETVIYIKNGQLCISTVHSAPNIWKEIKNTNPSNYTTPPLTFTPRISKQAYISKVNHLLNHIQQGDIYEANFCQEFYSENVSIHPAKLYTQLASTSPTPFAGYYRNKANHLMCASPERYIQKKGTQIISQPIKGTIKRGSSATQDEQLKTQLYHSQKDRSENVMIVDLVRNDLSRVAQKNTVNVDELFGIYSFSNVHQMISTISCQVDPKLPITEIIKHTFPMGSMTGAPKIMAMKLIEKYEVTKRGLYSGAIGYISPTGDFDFNVVIRSLQYNNQNQYLSYMVGGAITQNSTAEQEYDECEVKAAAIRKLFS